MGRLFLVMGFLCSVAGATGARSADIGGNCCADLDERIQEVSGESSGDGTKETPEGTEKKFYLVGGSSQNSSLLNLPFFVLPIDREKSAIVFFDPKTSVFGGESTAFSDLTSAINGVVHDRLASNSPPNRLWAVAFGGVRDDESSDLGYGGVIAGFDAPLTTTSRAGFFGGWSTSEMEAAGGAHDIETDYAFGGLYARSAFGTAFADVVITGGRNDNDSARRIFNPLPPGGQEFARGDYEGYFVNPELLIGYRQSLWGRSLTPSLSLGYAGLFLDDLNEKGSIAAISLEERDIHLLMSRAQVQIEEKWQDGSAIWRVRGNVGLSARENLSAEKTDGILGNVAGFNMNATGDSAFGAFAGANISYSPAPSFEVFAAGEASVETDDATSYAGRAGASVKF